jgi:hypothetical protein
VSLSSGLPDETVATFDADKQGAYVVLVAANAGVHCCVLA